MVKSDVFKTRILPQVYNKVKEDVSKYVEDGTGFLVLGLDGINSHGYQVTTFTVQKKFNTFFLDCEEGGREAETGQFTFNQMRSCC